LKPSKPTVVSLFFLIKSSIALSFGTVPQTPSSDQFSLFGYISSILNGIAGF